MDTFQSLTIAEWVKIKNPQIINFSKKRTLYCPEINLFKSDNNLKFSMLTEGSDFIALFENCSLFSDGCILLSDDGYLIGEALTHRDYDLNYLFESKIISSTQNNYQIEDGTNELEIEEECYFIGGSNNIGHYIFEYLSRLYLFNFTPSIKSLTPIVYDDVPDRFLKLLSFFGIDLNKIKKIPRSQRVRFKKIWISSCPFRRDANKNLLCNQEAVSFLRTTVRPHGVTGHFGPPNRLFFSRSNAKSKRLINESEITSFLKIYNFQIIDPADYSIEEQLRMISNAEIIWAPLGAATSFTLFAPRDCINIEMSAPSVFGAYNSILSSRLIGQVYHRMVGEIVRLSDNPKWNIPVYADIYVKLEECKKVLDIALKTLALRND